MKVARSLALAFSLLTAGCGGGASAGASHATATAGIPVIAMTITVAEQGDKSDIVLRPDGTITAAGGLALTVRGNDVVDATGKPVLSLKPNGELVAAPPMGAMGKFQGDDTLQTEKGILSIGKDGAVHADERMFNGAKVTVAAYEPRMQKTAIVVLAAYGAGMMAKLQAGMAEALKNAEPEPPSPPPK